MRKVTEQVCRAFINGESKTVGNTTTDGQSIWLHGNKIAQKTHYGVLVSLAGWPTPTTRERINGLCQLIGSSVHCFQRDWVTYFSGKDGDLEADSRGWYKIS